VKFLRTLRCCFPRSFETANAPVFRWQYLENCAPPIWERNDLGFQPAWAINRVVKPDARKRIRVFLGRRRGFFTIWKARVSWASRRTFDRRPVNQLRAFDMGSPGRKGREYFGVVGGGQACDRPLPRGEQGPLAFERKTKRMRGRSTPRRPLFWRSRSARQTRPYPSLLMRLKPMEFHNVPSWQLRRIPMNAEASDRDVGTAPWTMCPSRRSRGTVSSEISSRVPPQFFCRKDRRPAGPINWRAKGETMDWQPARFLSSNCCCWTVPTLITVTLEMCGGKRLCPFDRARSGAGFGMSGARARIASASGSGPFEASEGLTLAQIEEIARTDALTQTSVCR